MTYRDPVVRSARGIFNLLMLLVPFATFVLGALAQGNKPTNSQTVIADYSNNGLNTPNAVAVAANGSVFIVDNGNNRVVEEAWNSSTKTYGAQTTVVSNLFNPSGVAVSATGSLFIADTGNNRLVVLPWNQTSGTYGQEATLGSGLNSPKGVAVAPGGSVYIADTGNNRVVEIPFDRRTGAYGQQVTLGIELLSPEGVAIGQGRTVYIANSGNNSVLEVPAGCNASPPCTSQTIVADRARNGLSYPKDLVVTASRNLYITQPNNNQVILLPWNGGTGTYGTPTEVGKDLDGPNGVAVDAAGNVYIADTHNNRVLKISQQQTGNRPSGNPMGSIPRHRRH
jgi:serine/threonine-protein kinase